MVRQGSSGAGGSRPKGSGRGQPARKPGRPPLSPVYRRRRLFAGVVLLLVIAVVVGGFVAVSNALGGAATSAAQPTGTQPSNTQESDAGAEPSDQASASPGASDSPSATPGAAAGDGCEQNLVTVTAATDKPSYAAGEKPLLTLKVTNNNKVPCEVNMGTSQMEYMITSGSDRIFSSKDCQAESTDLMKTIAPGKSETANFPWQRNRTVQGCEVVEAQPGTRGAYYVFTARLASKTSPKAVFQLY